MARIAYSVLIYAECTIARAFTDGSYKQYQAKRGKKADPPVKLIQHNIRVTRRDYKKGIIRHNKPIHERTARDYQKTFEALEMLGRAEHNVLTLSETYHRFH